MGRGDDTTDYISLAWLQAPSLSHESALSEGYRIGKAKLAFHISYTLMGLILIKKFWRLKDLREGRTPKFIDVIFYLSILFNKAGESKIKQKRSLNASP